MQTATVLAIALALHSISLAVADDGLTENPVAFEEESSTGVSGLKRGRSLLVEVDNAKSERRRNPKLGFNILLPNVPGMGGETTPSPSPDTNVFGGPTGDVAGTTAALGTTAVLIKGGILSGLMALKAAVLPPIFLGALILFLIAGAGFFTCSIVNCNRLVGDLFGSGPAPGWQYPYNSFNRNGIDDYDQQRPVYHSLDEGYKKYN